MWWLLTSLLAAPPQPPAAPQPTATGETRQVVLPEWARRAQAAEARDADATAFFAGERSLADAFPHRANAPLLDPTYLRVARAELHAKAARRARERVEPLPALEERALKELDSARTRALDAEDRADALDLRLLTALSAGLEIAPELADSAVASQIAQWRQIRDAVSVDEPTPEQQAAAAEAAEAQTALADLRADAVLAMTVASDTRLSERVLADLAAPTPAADDRLHRVQPLLGGTLAGRVDAHLASVQEHRAAELAQTRAARIAELEAAVLAAAAAPPPPAADIEASIKRATTALAAVDRTDPLATRIAQLELDLAQAQLQRRRVVEEFEAEPVEVSQQKADASREAAAAARASANPDEDAALAILKGKLADLHGEAASIYDEEAKRRAETSAQLDALSAALDQHTEAAAASRALGPLDPSRREQVDAAYMALRGSVTDIYNALDELAAQRRALRADGRERRAIVNQAWTTGSSGSAELAQLTAARETAAAEFTAALTTRERNAQLEIDQLYRLLDRARDERRAIKPEASSAARQAARRDFLPELVREVSAIPGQLAAGARGTFETIGTLPALLVDLTALWAFAMRSFELFVLLGGWYFGRRQAAFLVERVALLAEERFETPIEGDRAAWLLDVTTVTRMVLDIAIGTALLMWLTPRMPTLGLLALLWIARAAWRGAPSLVEACLSTPQQLHPALRIVSAESERTTLRTIKALVAWFFAVRTVEYLILHLLDADRLRDLASTLGAVAFWVVIAWLIWSWAPAVRTAMARQEEQSGLTRWVTGADTAPASIGARIMDLPRAAVGIAILGWRAIVATTGRLVEGRAGLGWLQSALARRQVRHEEDEDAVRPTLPEDLRVKLAARHPIRVPRPEADERLQAAFQAFTAEGRRGLVSVSGDRGSGKSHIVDRLSELLGGDVVRCSMTEPLRSEDGAIAWLAAAVGVEASDAEQLVDKLNQLPPGIYAVDDAQRCFRRTVGGHAPLRAMVEVMHRTSARHFWVLAVHGPTWTYLTGIAARLKLDAFRDHIALDPLSAAQMCDWLEGRATDAGWTCSYAPLVNTGPMGSDAMLAERRARTAYWRLLADASQGNPEVAISYWLTSLAPGAEGTLDVRMFRAPTADDLSTLSDELLFALTALVQHDELGADDLGMVLNRRPGSARASCRHLEGLGVVTFDAEAVHYRLWVDWRPAVQRLLRQKHFLHGGS